MTTINIHDNGPNTLRVVRGCEYLWLSVALSQDKTAAAIIFLSPAHAYQVAQDLLREATLALKVVAIEAEATPRCL